MALETPSRLPFMANTILNFHFDYWHTSLMNLEAMVVVDLDVEVDLNLYVH